MRDVSAEHQVPDRMWMDVQERLRRLATAPPVDRRTFATLLMCLMLGLDWDEIPPSIQSPHWDLRALCAACGAVGVWEAIFADAEVTGDPWMHHVGVVGAHKTWQDGEALLLGAAHGS